jgi:hypothetical protein
MQINKYLQHIIRKEAASKTKSVEECLMIIEQRKRQELATYLQLCLRRLPLTSRPTDWALPAP